MKEANLEHQPLFLTSYLERLNGLLRVRPHNKVVVLCPCKSIHTWGMRHRLDVAFVDGSGRVVQVHRGLAKRQIKRNSQACMVLERFASEQTWFEVYDELWVRPERKNDAISIKREIKNKKGE